LILAIVAARPKQLDFAKLYPAVTGISTIGLYLSYGIPLLLKWRAVRRGIWKTTANGPWNLGKWSVPVNLVALVWIAFITVLFVLPPNELTGYIFGATLVGLGVLYAARVHGRFKGPVPQAKSPEELLKLESGFSDSKPSA
jgi:amino acid transporter